MGNVAVGLGRAELPVIGETATVDVAGLRALLEGAIIGEVRFDRLSRALYSTDASIYQIVPLGVVVPRTEADVIATVLACGRYRVPVTARGGGTSQAGQAIGAGVQLDCSKYFNNILEIQPQERWARVQPGCVLDDLNLEVKRWGLQFAPDISTSNRATLGGMIANNSSGARSVLFGKTVDHVLELKVVLADGSVVHLRPLEPDELEARCRQEDREGQCYRTVRRLAAGHAEEIERRYPKILRRVGGYNLDRFTNGTRPFDLTPLLVGSEGTLGITLEAKVRLVELPRARAVLVVQFRDLLEALAATPLILPHRPAAVEVLDRYILDSTRLNAEAARLRDFIRGDPGAILLIEFYGEGPEELPSRLEALQADLEERGLGYHFLRATEAGLQSRIWKLRKAALGLSMAEKGDAKAISFVEDAAVAPEHLRDYIAELLAVVDRHGTTAGVYAHASVGCLHVRPVINLKTEAGVRQLTAIAEESAELVLKYGGALSGEHGDGLVRSPFQEKMFGPVLYQAFRELKRTFDPDNLLNPGKIVDAPPLTANLRYGPGYLTPDVPTTFDFSADGGLTRAAELCAGVGECRKKREGTMCPSYRATGEEQHSTRGRANALRLAVTGRLGAEGLTDPALMETLDLCLECKACKTECPTNVDMARLKAEVLHQYYRRHGWPWRNRLFGHVADLGRWGCRLAPLSNWLVQSRAARLLTDKLLAIDRRRELPAFAPRTFERRFRERWPDVVRANYSQTVLLFPDTFVKYYEPAVGLAAVEVLHRLGCLVIPGFPEHVGSAGLRCCGRPLISNGLLSQAVDHARHNVELLYLWARSGTAITACEPSCLLTIQDDYPALLRGEGRRQAETVAAACRTFEDFADSVPETFPGASLGLRPGPKKILVQGHCHQRALVGLGPTLRLLRHIPGAQVVDLDAGCCGLAGSFGYEKEHYEVSRLVGEQALFPAVRQAEAETVIVAPGFSCRRQIAHFTGRTAWHPAELLFSLLDEPTSR
ncbi:MAG: FAD-binding protein [Planctomycetes bacterium]|nr:FAD-binding protein [Planctomycetota bacterium]